MSFYALQLIIFILYFRILNIIHYYSSDQNLSLKKILINYSSVHKTPLTIIQVR